jgi:hypothetical protein
MMLGPGPPGRLLKPHRNRAVADQGNAELWIVNYVGALSPGPIGYINLVPDEFVMIWKQNFFDPFKGGKTAQPFVGPVKKKIGVIMIQL